MINGSDFFDWYELYELGCNLVDSDDEACLRTAINRFYYSAFCQARDYLINNKIYGNADLKKDLLSNHAVVHKTTQDILVYYNNYNLKRQGRKISSRLRDLRNYRNFVDYDSNRNHNFKFMAKQSKIFSKFIFDNLEEF